MLQRLEEKIERLPWSGCWIFMGRLNERGYGIIDAPGVKRWKPTLAHRLAFGRPVPSGMFVLHTCDVRCCVNPEHLWLGTIADNQHDMIRKGRGSKPPRHTGEHHPLAKLTWAAVAEIRSSSQSQRSLARKFGVSRPTIRRARNRETWIAA